MPGGLGRAIDGDANFGGALDEGGAVGEVEGVALTGAVLEVVGVGGAGDCGGVMEGDAGS
jgi:hypothetical protein